ncbi:MAG: NHLP bacteriocin system secretion protein [Proteobacteria bacterium]|nr:NHLP bacteriocin system secretion protein [Pseudomonadota bacterium]
MSKIFRKVSLDRLSSPDQLDTMIQITSSKGWISLLTMGLLIAAALAWGFMGSIPTKVSGMGLFIKTGGVYEIVAPSPGRIKDIYFSVGDVVEKGRLIARIEQTDLLERLNDARATLAELNGKMSWTTSSGTQEILLNKESAKQSVEAMKTEIKNLEKQKLWLMQKEANQKKLLADGIITEQVLIDTQQSIDSVKSQVSKINNDVTQIEIQLFQVTTNKDSIKTDLAQQISAKKREIAGLIIDLEQSSSVMSPYSGQIIELSAERGVMVNTASPLAKVELVGKNTKTLEAVIYFSAMQGKKIKRGMKAQLSPTTTRQEEYGFMLGLVTSVSEFPVSEAAMMNVLHNSALVNALTAGGAPIEVHADLIPDPRTFSGFKWSSGKGPELKMGSGTMCLGNIVVEQQKPINMVIPLFKKYVLGEGITNAKG